MIRAALLTALLAMAFGAFAAQAIANAAATAQQAQN